MEAKMSQHEAQISAEILQKIWKAEPYIGSMGTQLGKVYACNGDNDIYKKKYGEKFSGPWYCASLMVQCSSSYAHTFNDFDKVLAEIERLTGWVFEHFSIKGGCKIEFHFCNDKWYKSPKAEPKKRGRKPKKKRGRPKKLRLSQSHPIK
jgi:hypothetical protein